MGNGARRHSCSRGDNEMDNRCARAIAGLGLLILASLPLLTAGQAPERKGAARYRECRMDIPTYRALTI